MKVFSSIYKRDGSNDVCIDDYTIAFKINSYYVSQSKIMKTKSDECQKQIIL